MNKYAHIDAISAATALLQAVLCCSDCGGTNVFPRCDGLNLYTHSVVTRQQLRFLKQEEVKNPTEGGLAKM